MQSDQKKEKKRKSVYEKPRLRKIELAAEEVLGIGCKIATGSSPGSSPPCWTQQCNMAGS